MTRPCDSDGTATAAACEDMPVLQDCQARARRASPVIRFIDEMFANQDLRIREAIARSAEHDVQSVVEREKLPAIREGLKL